LSIMALEQGKKLLIKILRDLASSQLESQGGLRSFGATLNSNREIQVLMPDSQFKSGTKTEELFRYWDKTLSEHSKSDTKTVGFVCTTLVHHSSLDFNQALYIKVEEPGISAEELLIPYKITGDATVSFGQALPVELGNLTFAIDSGDQQI
jgi:hypothetical protein